MCQPVVIHHYTVSGNVHVVTPPRISAFVEYYAVKIIEAVDLPLHGVCGKCPYIQASGYLDVGHHLKRCPAQQQDKRSDD
jgi:hypothetical protein